MLAIADMEFKNKTYAEQLCCSGQLKFRGAPCIWKASSVFYSRIDIIYNRLSFIE